MKVFQRKISHLCFNHDLDKKTRHLHELHEALLASEDFLGELSNQYKNDIKESIKFYSELTTLLKSKDAQQIIRAHMNPISGGGVTSIYTLVAMLYPFKCLLNMDKHPN